jgi:subtilisin-like proprotein convertase family protein
LSSSVRTFHVTFPTQTLSGSYSITFGQDTQANYAKDTSLNAATVVNRGTGYNAGDLLTVQGGTFASAAQFQVATVTAVTGPLTPGNIVAGSSGYNVGDFLTVVGGTATTAATVLVTGVQAGGVITSASVITGGSYTATIPNPYGVTDITTPAAFGAAFNLSFAVTKVELAQPGSYSVNPPPVSVTSGTGTGSGATLALAFGNEGDTNLNAGLDLLRGGSSGNGALVPTTYASGTINTPLPAGHTVNSVINVPDSYLVEGVTLQLSINHQNDPDLTATLIAPDGLSVVLFSGVGSTGTSPHANFTNTTFDDTAPNAIQLASTSGGANGIGIGAGPFTPQFPLGTFKGDGSLGNWTLQITSNSSNLAGTLVNWNLTLKSSVAGSGLGEPVADQFSAPFRIFTQDPTSSVAQHSWTAVGGASLNSGAGSGRIGGLAVDPSDPSGNTVYVAGASGNIWKTTNFLTAGPNGPSYVPVTTLGPGFSLNTGSIAVFGRNSDPNQSIIFVATGEGDTGTPGAGFLRSMDGGRTWRLLDSRTNVDGGGNVLAFTDPLRDHVFANKTSFKVIVDPVAAPGGGVIVYAALSSGIWRSTDSGGHWTLLQSGIASDVVLAAGSAGAPSGNLQILYGAIEGQGVFFTTNAPTTANMSIRNGGGGDPLRLDTGNGNKAIPVGNLGVNPSGANGRIVLAAPAFTGDPLHPLTTQTLQDTLYQGWLYAAVEAGGVFQGLYETKDFGLNWTKIRLPVKNPGPKQISTNDDSIAADYSVDGSAKFAQANYDVSLAVDPNNPSVVYFGGTADANPALNGLYGGFIRVDTTLVQDVFNEVARDNSNNDGGLIQTATTGGVVGGGGIKTSNPGSPYVNMLRDPDNPFNSSSSLLFAGITQFNNSGEDARYGSFTGGGLGGTDQHRLIAIRDPLTGHTRVIFGDDQGVWTGTDNGTGNAALGIGSAKSVLGSRNGNLQITQFYYGAAQPSTLAADLAGAEFYGMAQDDGFPQSNPHVLDNGNLNWTGIEGDGGGVATDQTGSGSAYQYKWPCCINDGSPASDFFKFTSPATGEIGRTQGLVQLGDNPATGVGQWPFTGVVNFAVNPIDPTAIVISSFAGRGLAPAGVAHGTGKQWFPIADPTDLDGSQSLAMAYGAPVNATAPLSDFIYVGTKAGNVFVTFTGGGVGPYSGASPWKNISAGLDGRVVEAIVTNPARGSHEAYAVTDGGVFWMQDSSAANPTWVNISNGLFSAGLTRTLFNDPAQALATLKSLNAIQADWRYAIPDNLSNPAGPKHPVLYVGGEGGVYRSLDKGVTWTYFPNITIDGALQEGGLLPSVKVTDLSLSLGNINPINGLPAQAFGRNMLVATTYGMGTYVIRLDDQITVPGGNPLYTYVVSGVEGPHVSAIGPVLDAANPLQVDGIQVNFSGPVDPATVTAAKVNSITDPTGAAIPVSSILDLGAANHNQYEIVFATPLTTFGFYHVSLGPNISDYGGNKMDQNQNFINGENQTSTSQGDVYSGRFLFQPFTNHAPVLALPVPAATLLSVNEDATAATITGTDVNGFVLGLTPSPRITDPDNTSIPGYQTSTPPTTAPVGIAVTGVDNTSGVWQFSLNGGASWTSFGAPSNTSARLLEASSNGIASNDRIRYLPNPNTNGTATFTFRAWDETSGLNSVDGSDGGTADTSINGGATAFSTGTATATITVNFVNDQPSFTKGADQAKFENDPAQTINPWATNVSQDLSFPADANEAGQTLNFIVTNDNNPLFTPGVGQPAVSPTGVLTYTIAPDATGMTTVSVTLMDNGGTAFGGLNTSVLQTFIITVADPQVVTSVNNTGATVAENATTTITTAKLAYNDDGGAVAGPAASEVIYTVTTLPTGGTLKNGVTAITLNGTFTQADINAGTITYAQGGGDGNDSFQFKVQDDTGTQTAAQTFRITLTDPQVVTPVHNTGATVTENATTTITTAKLAYTEDGNAVGSAAASEVIYTVTTLPTGGTLKNGVTAITLNGTFTQADINAGAITYLQGGGDGNDSFQFTVRDDTGAQTAAQTFSITVTDPQVVTPVNNTGLTVSENTPTTITTANLAYSDDGGAVAGPGASEVIYTVTKLSTGGTLKNGVTAITLNGTFTQADINAGNITYVQGGSDASPDTFQFKVQDDTGPQTAAQTFTLTVNFVNDQPSFTASNPPIANEDAGASTVPGWVTAFNPGGAPDANEAGQTVLAYHVTGVTNTSLFAAGGQPTVDTSGNLHYTLLPNVSGASNFTVTVQDNGGTANGGVDTSAAQIFTLTVNFVNDQPTFVAVDPPTTTVSSGAHAVPGWASFNPGPVANESGQAVKAYAVSAISNPSLFTSTGRPVVAANGTLTYTLAPNVLGTSKFTVTVQDDGGTLNGGIDTSTAQTFTLTVVKNATTTVISAATPAPSAFGQAVTFNATVTAQTGSPLPTAGAYMFFYIDGAYVGNSATPTTKSATSATYAFTTTATQMGAGSHKITALWIDPADAGAGSGGDNANFMYSVSSGWNNTPGAFMQTVNPAATTTLQASSPTWWAIGSPVTFYAVVYCSGPGSPGVPTGSVTFIVDGVPTSKALDNVSGPYAYTTFTVPGFTGGSHSVGVTYNQAPAVPMPNFAASAAATQTQNVRNATSLTLSASQANQPNAPVIFTAIVSTNVPSIPQTGTVTFSFTDANGNPVNISGTVTKTTLSSTSVAYRFTPSSALSAGTYHVTAHYSGDTNFDPADPTAALTITISNGRLT